MQRRQAIAVLAITPATVMLAGCAVPVAPTTAPPQFPWEALIDFEGLTFEFRSARFARSFTNFTNRETIAADNFVILGLAIVNKTGVPLPPHLQPIFRLRDAGGAVYEPDAQHEITINIGKPGRLAPAANMNPNVRLFRELVFEVPKAKYIAQVIVPNQARLGFAGGITASGRYFFVDLSSQLAS